MRYRRVRIEGAIYFFTVVTYKRRPIFRDPDAVAKLMTAITSVQASHPFEISAQVVLPDHLHALWSLPDEDSNYPMRWRQIKAAFTRAFENSGVADPKPDSRRTKREQTIWQRRYWEHTIRGDKDFTTHVEYIHFNPVKHRLAARPRDWPHSTFHDWVARGIYEVDWAADAESDFGPVAIQE